MAVLTYVRQLPVYKQRLIYSTAHEAGLVQYNYPVFTEFNNQRS